MKTHASMLPPGPKSSVRRLALIAIALVVFSFAPTALFAGTTISVTVPSNTGPWLSSLNPAFNYSQNHDYAPPVVIDATSGFAFSPGSTLTVTRLSGLVSPGAGYGSWDANGEVGNVVNNVGGYRFPAFYMDPLVPVNSVALVGTFANNGVIVGIPFLIGNGPKALTIPAGANQLLLGINDRIFGDNFGAFNVTVSSPVVDSAGPVTTAVALTPNPSPVNQPVVLAANIDDTDTGLSNIHTAEYSIDGGPFTALSGTFDTSPTTAAAAVIPAFSTPGVYSVCVRGTDAAGNVGPENCVLLAVYDPDGGFVTGGGWIMSPEGAYTPDSALGGKATFGFVSRYLHGANVPTGDTQFVFHAAGFRFQSTSYDWLVVAGARAKYKGTGSINGQPGFRFLLSAIDGNLLGGGNNSDTFRLKVEDQDGVVIYDNQMGAAEGDDPTTELGGGNIVIHKP